MTRIQSDEQAAISKDHNPFESHSWGFEIHRDAFTAGCRYAREAEWQKVVRALRGGGRHDVVEWLEERLK